MKTQSEFFTIREIKSGKFISRFTKKSGKVYLVSHCFKSNYFIGRNYAENWLKESGLNAVEYEVHKFF